MTGSDGHEELKRPRPHGAPVARQFVTSRPVITVLHSYTNESAIYGTVLVSALIAVGWRFNTDYEVLIFVLGTVSVFWLAHVYAGAVARPHTLEPRFRAVGRAVAIAVQRSIGMVVAMLLPSFFLFLATIGVLDEYVAYYIALWLGVAILVALGYLNSARRGSPVPLRLVSALITGALGLGIIWLSSFVH